MPCDEKDIANLWEAITDQRKAQAENALALARIEEQGRGVRELLSERCEARLVIIGEIKARQSAQEHRMTEMEKRERFAQGKAAGIAAVIAFGIALLSRIWK